MDALTIVVHWLHVFLGIFWFGSVLFLDFVLLPVLMRVEPQVQRPVAVGVGNLLDPVLTFVVAPAVIGLGIVRGTLFGPINSLADITGTLYGLTWLAALALALGIYAWGHVVLRPRVRRLNTGLVSEEEMPDFIRRLRGLTATELVAFLVLFSLMVLMRFGL